MKSWTAMLLMLPAAISFANEPAHSTEAKPAEKPAGNSTAHTPIKNAPPTQVDNLKPAKEGKAKAESAGGHEAAAAPAAPTEPPVVRYVPPKYSSSSVPVVRTVVPSKAPRAANSAHGSRSASHTKKSHSSSEKVADMSVTPGIVRVMPSTSLPAGKVLPQGKMNADSGTAAGMASNKPRLTWGETTIVKPVAAPAPEIYIVRDPELRWQQYSYP
ncbi:hypothetical protein HZU75_03460 [Chitinibacter fontanus]|uniref:Uncharacterized protein n=1 Tax=Chitinibacter fontanus TaxID=1737446 RepID=A0A7D5V937_9NEIS|nr:hypothetical protein [Chitinibacter fontanus]QLI80660.1 hypothetical protein HZU75_03460 [Chitinibacter fontanus]